MQRSKGVNIKNLTKIYLAHSGNSEFKAVDNISIDIKAGEFVTLLGPSGCGKTTTLRMIAGFEIPTEGEIYLGGDKINILTPDKRDTAMVFQSYALFPHLNIYDNIAYGLKLKKMEKKVLDNKVRNIIDLVGLKGMEARYPNQLSGGQQQRVALARALVMEPGVLLFDEPLSNLDAKLRVYMRTEIRKIQKKVGITAVYVTHDQSEAMSLSDRIIIMNKGIVEQVGTPKEIYHTPATEFVADFIGTANFLPGKIIDAEYESVRIKVQDEVFKVPYKGAKSTGDTCKIVLRPEAIEIGEKGIFKGKIITSTFMGAFQDYSIQVGETIIKCEDFNPQIKKIYEEGQDVMINFSKENVHII
ncbi:ABC transporter ATP-binding protein [Clostridium septicum]|uniref:ABC transporter ATP-binding protein n=1 Tax=Clostridium septicum TaxID=1504 RepID=A0A9N7PIB9_CLOSE|nr:ABC transporter ATP-binding protein [Clostridium septicum]AYE33566.1 ABC transporter ATP-binding protein [Clostridium septicum]MDU1314871.1 ABC transporter ATP-binding protein [Clostridium septicum]QAS61729.1 ABC transporter ATP-binding protein [Clostridium septicum]UEC21826.1 ABC transporter ATP-binding protein [Clostridium septicum]USS00122.1 ABC transporter ATP-binding protein [Clostridium septicum]